MCFLAETTCCVFHLRLSFSWSESSSSSASFLTVPIPPWCGLAAPYGLFSRKKIILYMLYTNVCVCALFVVVVVWFLFIMFYCCVLFLRLFSGCAVATWATRWRYVYKWHISLYETWLKLIELVSTHFILSKHLRIEHLEIRWLRYIYIYIYSFLNIVEYRFMFVPFIDELCAKSTWYTESLSGHISI